ncbi:MAG: PBSX family phage terminase large subunit [Lachnospiraceae bacterium]|nr:PBSX family phage terminase large subunit [Lachnospiraceae bacterium]
MPFSRKQREYFDHADKRWNFKVGATRSGKTYADYFMIMKRIRARMDKAGLVVILGVSQATIERNVLAPMREMYGERCIGRIGPGNRCNMFGEKVYCLGAEKRNQVAKLRGTSIKYAYGDEVAEWSQEVFELLKSRLDREYSCFDGSLNPKSPTHWLKGFLENADNAYVQHYTIFDNPFLPRSFVDDLCREYAGTVYYKRYILGEWALAEGLVYPMYLDAVLPTDFGDLRDEFKDYVLSIDYGTLNAFSAELWGYHEGVWYLFDEYYYSGRDSGDQKTDEDYGNDMDEFTKDIKTNGKIRTIVDPSAASFITLLQKRGRYKVLKADNAVEDGIRETATALKTGRIKVYPTCKAWQREAAGYVWEDSEGADKPVKINDHAMDAMRYFVKTMRIAKPKRANNNPYTVMYA